mmetsp:Transcript_2900/g.4724  ORF Transcript_2900/g.4724 Transcript_2900/m.4724 type:complete len:104 (-) Transcript_2900:24-335(-)
MIFQQMLTLVEKMVSSTPWYMMAQFSKPPYPSFVEKLWIKAINLLRRKTTTMFVPHPKMVLIKPFTFAIFFFLTPDKRLKKGGSLDDAYVPINNNDYYTQIKF